MESTIVNTYYSPYWLLPNVDIYSSQILGLSVSISE